MAEENLVVGTVGLLTTEKVGTVMTGMTDGIIGHGAPWMIDYFWDYRHDGRTPHPNPKLNLKPWNIPKEDASFVGTSQLSRAASIFGRAKPVVTAAREEKQKGRGYGRSRRHCSVSWTNQN